MVRMLLAALLALLPVAAKAQVEQQALVDRATLTVQDLMSASNGTDAPSLLARAKAVMICPQVMRIAFIFGGSGADCVLVARDAAGGWSYPAFYGMGSGSAGFQAGIQDAEIMMLILTERGLDAVMDSQFKLGAEASVAFVSLGAGVEGATTAALGADIVVAGQARGLFAGVSLQGSVLKSRTDYNRAYYGQDLAARQIVLQMQGRNPGADPLREVLMRYGAPAMAGQAPPPPPGPYGRQPGGPPPGPYGAPAAPYGAPPGPYGAQQPPPGGPGPYRAPPGPYYGAQQPPPGGPPGPYGAASGTYGAPPNGAPAGTYGAQQPIPLNPPRSPGPVQSQPLPPPRS
ncbi:MAG: lipid-binding SYLF domain-containing protein [Acetobacteraceae bacterium]|nr:lipid-binding SYLF domain-containing protein [Acetobacteraceae bacterium]